MDILSHTISGLAIGTTATHFSKRKASHKFLIIFVSGLAAFFPDLDAISYWSEFDSTFGEWFGLRDSGVNIYHQKRWFSRHGFFHSFLMAVVFCAICVLLNILFSGFKLFRVNFRLNSPFYISVFLSYLVHLFEDMITPEFVWGGVAFMFPSENYWGGSGKIWWWNNYDLFLIVVFTFFLELTLSVVGRIVGKSMRWIALSTFVITMGVFIHQFNHRKYDFNYKGFSEHHEKWNFNEVKSKSIQKEILGDDLFELMTEFDESIPIWF